MKKRKIFNLILSGLIVLQTIYVVAGLNPLPETANDDTRDYIAVAEKLKHGEWSTIWLHNRPPGYPLVLIAAENLTLKPHNFIPILNRTALLFLLWSQPLSWAIFAVVSSLTLLMSYSVFISHENLLMTESILPGFIALGILASVKARKHWKEKRYTNWMTSLCFTAILLQSLKPSFKLFPFLELFWLIPTLQHNTTRKKVWFSGFVTLLVLNLTLFGAAGKDALQANRAHLITHVPLTVNNEERQHMPAALQATLAKYEEYWKNPPPDYNGTVVSYAEGCALFNYAIVHHPLTFLAAGFTRIKNLFFYSGWAEDRGQINKQIGIPFGAGSLGLLFTSTLLGLIVGIAFHRNVRPESDFSFVSQTLWSFIISGFFVQLIGTAIDVGRISLQWVPLVYVLVALYFCKITTIALKKKGQRLRMPPLAL